MENARTRNELLLSPSLLPAWQVEERFRGQEELSPCSFFFLPSREGLAPVLL